MSHDAPTHLDLFSGIGGFALAAQWAGFRTVGFCEIEPYAQAVLKARFGAVADASSPRCGRDRAWEGHNRARREAQRPASIHSDIFTLDGSRYRGVSLLTGGFPCQPFSVAGKRRGAADDRAIWPQMRRVIEEARPGWVLAENVFGIINMELDRVLSDMEVIGYSVGTLVVPACAVDAKHRRDRVWIVGHAEGCDRGLLLPTGHEKQDTESCGTGEAVGHAASELSGPGRSRGPKARREAPDASRGWCEWIPEPAVGRVAHGIPRRVDRLKGLGNAIVPQVAFQILREIRRMIG